MLCLLHICNIRKYFKYNHKYCASSIFVISENISYLTTNIVPPPYLQYLNEIFIYCHKYYASSIFVISEDISYPTTNIVPPPQCNIRNILYPSTNILPLRC